MEGKGGYGIVYREIMRSKELIPEAKAIYAYLCSFADSGASCYPGAELMREELQMGNDRFYKHMHLLTDARIVRKEQSRSGNRWGNTVYIINHIPDFQLSQNENTEKTSAELEKVDFQLSHNTSTQNERTENRRAYRG